MSSPVCGQDRARSKEGAIWTGSKLSRWCARVRSDAKATGRIESAGIGCVACSQNSRTSLMVDMVGGVLKCHPFFEGIVCVR